MANLWILESTWKHLMPAALRDAAGPLAAEAVTHHLATSHHHHHLHFPCKQGVPPGHEVGAAHEREA